MTISSSGRDDQHYCSFYVGQKVVCIDILPSNTSLTLDAVYTIAGMKPNCRSLWDGAVLVGLKFAELGHDYFDPRLFRPITDISVFTALLKTVDQPVKESV